MRSTHKISSKKRVGIYYDWKSEKIFCEFTRNKFDIMPIIFFIWWLVAIIAIIFSKIMLLVVQIERSYEIPLLKYDCCYLVFLINILIAKVKKTHQCPKISTGFAKWYYVLNEVVARFIKYWHTIILMPEVTFLFFSFISLQ